MPDRRGDSSWDPWQKFEEKKKKGAEKWEGSCERENDYLDSVK